MKDDSKKFDAHLFICTNKKENGESCAPKGAAELRNAMKAYAQDPAKGWKHRVRVNNSGCLGPCEKGINAVLYPQGQWFSHLTEDSAPELQEALEKALGKKD